MIATTILLIVSALGYLSWDIYVAFFNKIDNSKDTITGRMYAWSRTASTLPYGMGVIVGHILWPASIEYDPPQPWSFIAMIAIGGVLGLVGWVIRNFTYKRKWFPLVWFQLGIPLGHFLFPHHF